MIDRKSRYHGLPTLPVSDSTGETQELLDLREIPPTRGVLRLTPTDTDRLDLLAWRYYRDPTRFWRMCDASGHLDPFDVVVPGVPFVIPPDR